MRYTAYGIGIESEIPLPELMPSEAPVDAVIRLAAVELPPGHDVPLGQGFWSSSSLEAGHFELGVGAVCARGGHEILVDPVLDPECSSVRDLILRPAMGLLLHQRGLLVLHASAVGVRGGAVAFLGHSTSGKSTTAAALHSRGYTFLTDDMAALSINMAGNILVLPGIPRLRVSEDAAHFLGYAPSQCRKFDLQDGRSEIFVEEGFANAPFNLARIFLLATGKQMERKLLTSEKACLALISNSFNSATTRDGDALNLRQCADVASQITVEVLGRPRCLSGLSQVAKMVEADPTVDPELRPSW